MKRMLAALLAVVMLFGASVAESDGAIAAESFLGLLSEGKFEEAFDQSDEKMRAAMGSAEAYGALWNQLLAYGAYEGVLESASQESGGVTAVTLRCGFAGADLVMQIAVDSAGKVCGMFITDVSPKAPAAPEAKTETLVLREGESDQTEAILTLPEGEESFPAVVLVHGSGPSDKNESAYGLAPFSDLAEGLAKLGIASVRYDKYTFAHADLLTGDELSRFTVDQEYLADFSEAVRLLEADPRVSAIYLVGHSQGAMLAPRLLACAKGESRKLSGAVLLCGTPKHLWEIQYAQNCALLKTLPAEQASAAEAVISAELKKLDSLATMTDEQLMAETFFGISAWYQADEMKVDAAETAMELDLPLLIVGGGKDWQVSPEDNIEAWKAALGDWPGAAYRLYPNMNHLLCEQEGDIAGNAGDYAGLSGVSEELIRDIAGWILG